MPEPIKLKKRCFPKEWSFIHVNQTLIKQGNVFRRRAQDGEITQDEALAQMPHALSVKSGKTNTYGSTIIVYHPETGEELMRVEHTPFDPYACGAQIVIKTQMRVVVLAEKTTVAPRPAASPENAPTLA